MDSRNVVDKVDKRNPAICDGKGAKLVKKNSSSELKTGKPPSINGCHKQLFPQKFSTLESKIPKCVLSLDEKYLLRCLEWMHVNAFKSTPSYSSASVGIISNSFGSRGSTLSMARLAIECPFFDLRESVLFKDIAATATIGDSVLGTITASKSMMNILRSPLLHQLGALGSDPNVGRRCLFDNKSTIPSDVPSSPVKLVTSLPKKLKDMVLRGDGYDSNHALKRHAYSSSTSSSSSDQSSSVISDTVSQGMLKCTWKDRLPNYMFSVDDLGEVYVANLFKIQSPDDKSLEYIYNFHSKPHGEIENEARETQLKFVGKMQVSSSMTRCPQNAEILETRFVLFGSGDNCTEELRTSAHSPRKIKGLKKKIASVVRTGNTRRRRIPTNYTARNAILEDAHWEPPEEVHKSSDNDRCNIVQNSMPNLELAAMIMRNHVYDAPKELEIGGWGLKFLKRSVNKQADELRETSACQRNSGECSTSMNILVPAGYHGGPRTGKGGPSSIMERWTSGGHCDCGGWDVGCPLTVISTKPSRQDNLPPLDDAGDCKAVDLFVKGSKRSVPVMQMTNIHEDLYYIHYDSALSALQSFAIAAAIIHHRTPVLRPKLLRLD